jgi:hypothetical protein
MFSFDQVYVPNPDFKLLSQLPKSHLDDQLFDIMMDIINCMHYATSQPE